MRGCSWVKIIAVFQLVILLMGCGLGEIDTKDPQQAAQAMLGRFLSLIPEESSIDYGFESKQECKRAVLGKPYQEYSLVNQTMLPTNHLRFPVTVDDQQRALLTVALMGDQWKAVDFGATVLAKDLQDQQSELVYGGEQSDQEWIILRYYAGNCDFLMQNDIAQDVYSSKIYPLTSAKKYVSKSYGRVNQYYTFDELKRVMGE